MRRRLLLAAIAVLCAACVQNRQPPSVLQNPFRPIPLSELRTIPQKYAQEMVSFSATIGRVEETTGGTWLYLKDGTETVILYMPTSFGGELRESIRPDEVMEFEVRVGEKRLTPKGPMALEVYPFQITKTRLFDQPVDIAPPDRD